MYGDPARTAQWTGLQFLSILSNFYQ